jgi:hypothetical protein
LDSDSVSFLERINTLTTLGYRASNLVARYYWRLSRYADTHPISFDHVEVGAANTASGNLDENLPSADYRHRHFFNGKWVLFNRFSLMKKSGFHAEDSFL